MTLFASLKALHICCAVLSVAGFTLRGYWMATADPRLQGALAKRLPHVIDTLLLASALGMLWLWRLNPLDQGWLVAKILALLLYIALGMVALRFGRSRNVKVGAWLLALVTAAYIISVAYTKNPWVFG